MNEKEVLRIMPNSLEAEQSVIGSMIMSSNAIGEVESILSVNDFYHKTYALLYETILELHDKGKAVDPVVLQDALKEKGAPPEACDTGFIREIIQVVPTSVNAKQYAEIVREKALLRRIIKINEVTANECYAGDSLAEDILEKSQEEIFSLIKNKSGHDYVPINEVMIEAIEKINLAYKNKGKLSGIPTGFEELDNALSGLQPSDFILVAARPSMGKTAFVLNIASNVVLKKGIATAIFSLEMSSVQLANRLISLETTVAADSLRKGNLSSSDWDKLLIGVSKIAESKLIIDDTPGISISELRTKARKYKLENNIGLIIIDYLQLMSSGGRDDSRQQEISAISRALKGLARELNVPVIALSQLSRAPEQRQDHRPMLSDLRESGAIEQDADVVMFIYRDDYYNKESEEKNVAEIIIAKQRNGPVGTKKLAWIPEQTRFANLGKSEDKSLVQ